MNAVVDFASRSEMRRLLALSAAARGQRAPARSPVAPIRHRECQWPIGEPRQAGFRFCGDPVAEGRPYCVWHHGVAYGPDPEPIPPPIMELPRMADQRLVSMVDRIVALEEDRRALGGDIKDIFAEAKSAGYDTGALRLVVRRRLEDEEKRLAREDRETIRDLMLRDIGAFENTPLARAAAA